MGPFSRFKYLYGIVLVLMSFFTINSAVSLAMDFLSSAALEPSRIGHFAMNAAQIPLWLHFFQLSLGRPSGLREELEGRVFERSARDQIGWSIVLWTMSCGFFLSALLTGGTRGSLFGGALDLWFGLLGAAFALIVALLAFFGVWTRRIVLNKDGISMNKVKDGPIRWEDVSDIRFVNFLGQRQIALDLADPLKYGLKRSPLVIYPATYNAGAEPMMKVFQQGRTLNLL